MQGIYLNVKNFALSHSLDSEKSLNRYRPDPVQMAKNNLSFYLVKKNQPKMFYKGCKDV